ncbi:MAG: formate dehydrogenase accessory sulfurtransferase FdhD [Caldilineaceae bacterium]|nr:formate dehydrogenase accessory sulfurtransferase FdhD [Caldilineaceae bacterium]
MIPRVGSKVRTRVTVVEGGRHRVRDDQVAAEEPLEIRLQAGGDTQTVAVTMRTPGNDFELAAGFLHNEGIVGEPSQVSGITYCVDADVDADQRYNIVNVGLRLPSLPELATLERHFYTTSACGVCGKASLDAIEMRSCPALPAGPKVSPSILTALPEKLRAAQGLFEATGGLHAAGLFDAEGNLVCLREDVGRHNAVDKLIGWAFMQRKLPLHGSILLVSGRASFEILQKSTVAGLPVVCAVSAPSHLAVDVARRFGVTLIGFLRGERLNVYAGAERMLWNGKGTQEEIDSS